MLAELHATVTANNHSRQFSMGGLGFSGATYVDKGSYMSTKFKALRRQNMKRINTIVAALLLIIIGLTAEAQAVTSGFYRCVALQDSLDGGFTITVPVVVHYNPTGAVQHITRIRVFNSAGTSLYDSGMIPVGNFPVYRLSSAIVVSETSGVPEGVQLIVNWKQSADTLAPIVRLTLITYDSATGAATTVTQSTCP